MQTSQQMAQQMAPTLSPRDSAQANNRDQAPQPQRQDGRAAPQTPYRLTDWASI